MNKMMFYDLETTGTDPNQHAIIQMAMIIEIDGKVVGEYDWRMKPHSGAAIDPQALKVNRITMDDIESYPEAHVQYLLIKDQLTSAVNPYDSADKMILVGYNNIAFDDQFLRAFFKLHDPNPRFSVFGTYFNYPSLDVLPMLAWLKRTGHLDCRNLKLQTVCDNLGIKLDNAHEALADTRATRLLAHRLLEMIEWSGFVKRTVPPEFDSFLDRLKKLSQMEIDDGVSVLN